MELPRSCIRFSKFSSALEHRLERQLGGEKYRRSDPDRAASDAPAGLEGAQEGHRNIDFETNEGPAPVVARSSVSQAHHPHSTTPQSIFRRRALPRSSLGHAARPYCCEGRAPKGFGDIIMHSVRGAADDRTSLDWRLGECWHISTNRRPSRPKARFHCIVRKRIGFDGAIFFPYSRGSRIHDIDICSSTSFVYDMYFLSTRMQPT